MKNQIWIYVVVGAVALAIGFYAGKITEKKKTEKTGNTGTTNSLSNKTELEHKLPPYTKKVKLANGTVVDKPMDYVLQTGETLA